jgi:uncharacterized BrkB/YihY/UPF0761 family membrane protein
MRKQAGILISVAAVQYALVVALFYLSIHLYVDRGFGHGAASLLERFANNAVLLLTLPFAPLYYVLPPEWHRDWSWHTMVALSAWTWACAVVILKGYVRRFLQRQKA